MGVVGDELLFLDPHECQSAVDLDEAASDDSSYHCPFLLHMAFDRVDPSLALGFLCLTEGEFDDLVAQLRQVHCLFFLYSLYCSFIADSVEGVGSAIIRITGQTTEGMAAICAVHW